MVRETETRLELSRTFFSRVAGLGARLTESSGLGIQGEERSGEVIYMLCLGLVMYRCLSLDYALYAKRKSILFLAIFLVLSII